MKVEVTLYYVGLNETDALQHLPFDSYDSANSYRLDTDKAQKIYSVTAKVDVTSIEEAT